MNPKGPIPELLLSLWSERADRNHGHAIRPRVAVARSCDDVQSDRFAGDVVVDALLESNEILCGTIDLSWSELTSNSAQRPSAGGDWLRQIKKEGYGRMRETNADNPGRQLRAAPRVPLSTEQVFPRTNQGEWSRHSDLNRGPAVYETAALPLSYVGADQE